MLLAIGIVFLKCLSFFLFKSVSVDIKWLYSNENQHNSLVCYSPTLSLYLLIDFSLTVKAATLIFISGRGSAISSAKEGKSGFIHNLVKS